MVQTMSTDLRKKSDALDALRRLVRRAASLRATQSFADDLRKRWKAYADGAMEVARGEVSDPGQLAAATARGVSQDLLGLDVVAKATAPVDFTSAEAALKAFEHALRVRNSASKILTDSGAQFGETLDSLRAVGSLIVGTGTLNEKEVQEVVSAAARESGIPVELLDGGPPLAERPIVDIVAHLLRREDRTLRTGELLDLMAREGKVLGGKNPAGAVRNSIVARGGTSPVVSSGHGRWRLRDWPEGHSIAPGTKR